MAAQLQTKSKHFLTKYGELEPGVHAAGILRTTAGQFQNADFMCWTQTVELILQCIKNSDHDTERGLLASALNNVVCLATRPVFMAQLDLNEEGRFLSVNRNRVGCHPSHPVVLIQQLLQFEAVMVLKNVLMAVGSRPDKVNFHQSKRDDGILILHLCLCSISALAHTYRHRAAAADAVFQDTVAAMQELEGGALKPLSEDFSKTEWRQIALDWRKWVSAGMHSFQATQHTSLQHIADPYLQVGCCFQVMLEDNTFLTGIAVSALPTKTDIAAELYSYASDLVVLETCQVRAAVCLHQLQSHTICQQDCRFV